jgi:RNA polymerase sigma-70 factor (ECF subfamily)
MLTDVSPAASETPPRGLHRFLPENGRPGRARVAHDDSLAREPAGRDTPAGDRQAWMWHLRRIHEHGDHSAFAELFAHFAPRVKAFLMKAGADETTAEECAQDVMATLWRKAHMFDPHRATVSTWIFTIARNRRIDMIRREKRPEPEALPWGPEEEPEPAERVALRQESERLVAALERLPAKQRELVEKAYFGDLSHSEIAEATGLPLGTIKSRIRLALEKLRHEMKVSE